MLKNNDEKKIESSNLVDYSIVGYVVTSILVISALVAYFSVQIKRKNQVIRRMNAVELECFRNGNTEGINANLTLDEQADLLPYDKSYEFPRKNLKLGQRLGAGAFGVVYEGFAHGILPHEEKTKVAVKMVKRLSNDEVSSRSVDTIFFTIEDTRNILEILVHTCYMVKGFIKWHHI